MGLFKYAKMNKIDLERLDLERRKVKALETIAEHYRKKDEWFLKQARLKKEEEERRNDTELPNII